ncbi:MAG: response regulator [Bdellovibrionales bacterium]|jgi:CheY-like chemotaxis protein|nr:response regulator [Bdellovibrionales bacterium]
MRFLIIDDEPLVRRSLARALQARGHESDEAVDGPEGLKRWLELRPDAVFVDILMPGMNGPDVVRKALAATTASLEVETAHGGSPSSSGYRPSPYRPTIALISAYSGEDSERLAVECGADCFIAKPFEDIFAVVDTLVSKHQEREKELSHG